MQANSEPGHGNTVAAWTTVIVLIVATAVGTFFFFLDMPALVWAAVVLALCGPALGYLLRKRGYGSARPAADSN